MASVQVVVEARPKTSYFRDVVRVVAFVGALGNLAAAAFASVYWLARVLWIVQAAFLGLVFFALGREERPLLVLNGHDLELPSGERLPLAEIERVVVRQDELLGPKSDAHDIIVVAGERELVLAREQYVVDARYVATLIEDARRKL